MTKNIKSKIFKGNVCENGTGEQGLLTRHTNPYKISYFLLLAIFYIFEVDSWNVTIMLMLTWSFHFLILLSHSDWFKVAVSCDHHLQTAFGLSFLLLVNMVSFPKVLKKFLKKVLKNANQLSLLSVFLSRRESSILIPIDGTLIHLTLAPSRSWYSSKRPPDITACSCKTHYVFTVTHQTSSKINSSHFTNFIVSQVKMFQRPVFLQCLSKRLGIFVC